MEQRRPFFCTMKDPTAVHMRSIVRQLRSPPPIFWRWPDHNTVPLSATHPLKHGPSPLHGYFIPSLRRYPPKDFLVSQNLISGDLATRSLYFWRGACWDIFFASFSTFLQLLVAFSVLSSLCSINVCKRKTETFIKWRVIISEDLRESFFFVQL